MPIGISHENFFLLPALSRFIFLTQRTQFLAASRVLRSVLLGDFFCYLATLPVKVPFTVSLQSFLSSVLTYVLLVFLFTFGHD